MARQDAAPIHAVLTICSRRKTAKSDDSASPADLPRASQAELAAAWGERVRELAVAAPASQLYGGRAFGLARDAAKAAGARLFVISAGLGLVPGDAQVPAYALTVARGTPDSVASRAEGRFDPKAWFEAVSQGPHSSDWSEIFAGGDGCVLVGLTRPYAPLVGEALAELPLADRGRLRVFGASLGTLLPKELHAALMPYDERLDAITPGTRADFAQRALADFAANVAPLSPSGDAAWHASAVRQRLQTVTAPERRERERRTDAQIEALIRARLRRERGIGRILRGLRDDEGVACEQARFKRLYWKAFEAEGLT